MRGPTRRPEAWSAGASGRSGCGTVFWGGEQARICQGGVPHERVEPDLRGAVTGPVAVLLGLTALLWLGCSALVLSLTESDMAGNSLTRSIA